MNCPRCSQEAIPAAPQCPACGFTLRDLDTHFGVGNVMLERLIDAAHCLKLREKEIVEENLETFEQRFPQLFASVYIGTLPEWTSVSEFGFWLLNRGTIPSFDIARNNHHAILLVLDPDSRTASITLGYAAENILRPKAILRSLAKARPSWRSGEYQAGITSSLRYLSKELRKACRRIPGAHGALAEQLDTLPPPELYPLPIRAPGSYRSDILESVTSHLAPVPGTSALPARAGGTGGTGTVPTHQIDLTGGVTFANQPTANLA